MPPAHETLADTIAEVTRAVPGVAGLHPGLFGEVGTYLAGRRVTGVRITDDRVDVHVTVALGAPVRDTAARVRAAVAAVVSGATVDVTVEDIASGPRRPHSRTQRTTDTTGEPT